jgi:hypothetical protein
MKDADIDKLTIAEVRAIAKRAGEALRDFHAVEGLLGRGRSTVVAEDDIGSDEAPGTGDDAPPVPKRRGKKGSASAEEVAAHRARQFQPVEVSNPFGNSRGGSKLTPGERSEKERLLRAKPPVDPNLPEDMQRMEAAE